MAVNYLIEIKNRVFLTIGMWGGLLFTSYYNKETLLFVLIKPWLDMSVYSTNSLYFISTNLLDIFTSYINLSYFISNQITYLYIIYHIITFLTPGFYFKEYKIIKDKYLMFIKLSFIFLYIFNKLCVPLIFTFFIKLQKLLNSKFFTLYYEAKINEYLNFYFIIYKWCYIIFFIFICILLLNNYFVKLKKFNFIQYSRKYLYLLFISLSTIISPPEISFQLLISFYIIIIYEIIIISILFKKIKTTINYNSIFNKVTN